ncbi:MAG: carboxypeptidase-like regulatory domain-containing protein [Candidatus Nitrosotenuis sp.]
MKLAILACLLGIVLIGTTTAYGATLWDFIVSAKFDQDKIALYDRPLLSGTVTDHAMKPVSDAEVQIRFANTSVRTTTNATGVFVYQFDEQTMSGTFAVNVLVKSGNLKGIGKTTLTVGSEPTTFNELYFKSNIQNDGNNPYAALKLEHYLKYLEEQEKRKQRLAEIELKTLELELNRAIAQQKLQESLEKEQPGYGVFSGNKYDRYVSSLNPAVQDKIAGQLNYTKNVFEEAKAAMKLVLDNGGSLEEARDAYFSKLPITREHIESFSNTSDGPNTSKIKPQEPKSSKKVVGLTVVGKR